MNQVRDVVMSVLGLEGIVRGDELDFLCPSHSDRRPSAGVNLVTGRWNCFSCAAGGDLASLVQAVKGGTREDALRFTRPSTPSALLASLQRAVWVAMGTLRGDSGVDLGLPVYDLSDSIPYLEGRGFDLETLKRFGVSWVKEEKLPKKSGGHFSIRDYAAIPIRDQLGSLLGWVYRACNEDSLRYIYTPGIKVGDLWFGEQALFGDDVVVTEGALDAMWVSQCGHSSLGLMGAHAFGASKARALTRFRTVTLFLDKDVAGVRAAKKIGELISHRVPTKVARYPRGISAKDPQELSPEQVRKAVEGAVQFDSWILRRKVV